MNETLKTIARLVATLVMLPRILAFKAWAPIIGADRALESSTQAIARIPGIRGQYLRRAFLAAAGVRCHPTATVCYGTLLSKPGSVLEQNVYVGPNCHLGWVHLEKDVLLAAGVHVPSGANIHGTADTDRPIREQEGRVVQVRIGEGTWVGSGSIVLADVGRHCVIGAGSVVTTPIPDYSIAVGVPARVVKERPASAARG